MVLAKPFPFPEPLILPGPATRVMSLRDGTKKMSKSNIPTIRASIFPTTPIRIAQKVKKAKTDPDALPSEEKV